MQNQLGTAGRKARDRERPVCKELTWNCTLSIWILWTTYKHWLCANYFK